MQSPPLTGVLATWLGHATTLVQQDGVSYLTDPVWCQRASMVQFAGFVYYYYYWFFFFVILINIKRIHFNFIIIMKNLFFCFHYSFVLFLIIID